CRGEPICSPFCAWPAASTNIGVSFIRIGPITLARADTWVCPYNYIIGSINPTRADTWVCPYNYIIGSINLTRADTWVCPYNYIIGSINLTRADTWVCPYIKLILFPICRVTINVIGNVLIGFPVADDVFIIIALP